MLCYGLFGLVYLLRGLHPAGSMISFALSGFVYLVGYRQLRPPALFEPIYPAQLFFLPTPTDDTHRQESPRGSTKTRTLA